MAQSKLKRHVAKPMLSATLTIKVYDENGKLTRVHRQPSRSFVKQFMLIWNSYFQRIQQTATDTTNTSRVIDATRTWSAMVYFFYCCSAAGDLLYGVICGTGTNAVTPTDVAVQTVIAHGGGAGQFMYGSGAAGFPNVDLTKSWINVIRSVFNQSGNAITINEVALYQCMTDSGGTYRSFCCLRDIVSPGVSVPNGSSAVIEYTYTATA